MLFILALRHLGSARTGAYFSSAPLVGALAATLRLHEELTNRLAVAGSMMACGVWLHLAQKHDHDHEHQPLEHSHAHIHDEHHKHAHDEGPIGEPQAHFHRHLGLVHAHPHYPDRRHWREQ